MRATPTDGLHMHVSVLTTMSGRKWMRVQLKGAQYTMKRRPIARSTDQTTERSPARRNKNQHSVGSTIVRANGVK